MREYFFQIILVLIGAILELFAILLKEKGQKILLGILGVVVLFVAAIWIGYELNDPPDPNDLPDPSGDVQPPPVQDDDPDTSRPSESDDIPPTSLYEGWVICWHGRDGYEYLIAYPENEVRQGLSLNFNLTNVQGQQLELANDSLKMCFLNGEWYGRSDNPWFPTVSYLSLSESGFLVCSDSPGCKGDQWTMQPENYYPGGAPDIQEPVSTDIHVITFVPSS